MPEYILDLYIVNEQAMKYISGSMIVDGELYDFETSKRLMLVEGNHTFEAVVPAGWKFSKWESLSGEGWTAVEISDRFINPTSGITSGNAFLDAYLLPVEVVPRPSPLVPVAIFVTALACVVYLVTR